MCIYFLFIKNSINLRLLKILTLNLINLITYVLTGARKITPVENCPPVGARAWVRVMIKIRVRGGGDFLRTVLTVSYASWKCMSLEIRISCNSQTFWISLSMKDNSFSLQLWRDTRKRALVQANRLYINYNIIAISLGVVQKVRSLKTSSFWPPPFSPCSVLFVLHVPTSPSKKVPRCLWHLFRIKNRAMKREKRSNFFVNLT